MVKVDYNKELDILMISEDSYDDFNKNIELGGFILDLDSKNEFLGLEIIDASQKIPLEKDELDNINNAQVNFEKNEEVAKIEIILEINSTKNIISSQYPLTAVA